MSPASNIDSCQVGYSPNKIVLHNLDNDRIIGQHYVPTLLDHFSRRAWRADNKGVIIHASIPNDASSYGAIGCLATAFTYLRGYDESLPYPSGCQDTDLIKRLQGIGVPMVRIASAAQAGFGISNDKVTGSVWRDHLKAKVGHGNGSSTW